MKGFYFSVLKSTANDIAIFLAIVQKNPTTQNSPTVCPLCFGASCLRGILTDFTALLISSSVSLEIIVMTLNLAHAKWSGSFLWYLFDWCEAIYHRDRPRFFFQLVAWHVRCLTHMSSSHNNFSVFSKFKYMHPECLFRSHSTKCSLWASGIIPEVNAKLLSNSA